MSTHLKQQIRTLMNRFSRQGSLSARREEIAKLNRFADWLTSHQRGVKSIENIGRRHIHEFYDYLISNNRSLATRHKYYLSIKKLWVETGRAGCPPQPKIPCDDTPNE